MRWPWSKSIRRSAMKREQLEYTLRHVEAEDGKAMRRLHRAVEDIESSTDKALATLAQNGGAREKPHR